MKSYLPHNFKDNIISLECKINIDTSGRYWKQWGCLMMNLMGLNIYHDFDKIEILIMI